MLLIIMKSTKFQILKKSYYNLIDDVAINKYNTIHTNENTNVTEINKLVIFNGNKYGSKRNRTYN